MNRLTVRLFFVFAFVISIVSCGIGLEQSRNYISPKPFNKEKWSINDAEMRWEVRPSMARYLVSEEILIGKSKAEIYRMLGEENRNNYDDGKSTKYELEQFYGSNIDPIAMEYLNIYFDKNNMVNRSKIEFRKTGDWIN